MKNRDIYGKKENSSALRGKEILERATANQERARRVLNESGIANVWERIGCRVNLVGSLRMGLLASHKDIDLHVYSRGITTESSFAIMAEIAKNPRVTEIKCINGLHTEERCVAWHVFYRAESTASDSCGDSEDIWQFDIIHIEEGTQYDGYFERMADRIAAVMTPAQKETILRLKFETPNDKDYHGVEYYEAVIEDCVTDLAELGRWVTKHRKKPMYYWIP